MGSIVNTKPAPFNRQAELLWSIVCLQKLSISYLDKKVYRIWTTIKGLYFINLNYFMRKGWQRMFRELSLSLFAEK